jgi:putative transposase
MAEHGVEIDHATLNRWVVKYSPIIATQAQPQKSGTSSSWLMPSHAFTMRLTALPGDR